MSMGTSAAAVAQAATSEITIHSMLRATGFTGVASKAAVGDSNSSSDDASLAEGRSGTTLAARRSGCVMVFHDVAIRGFNAAWPAPRASMCRCCCSQSCR